MYDNGLQFGSKYLFYFCMISIISSLLIFSYFTIHIEFRNMVSGKTFLKRDKVTCKIHTDDTETASMEVVDN